MDSILPVEVVIDVDGEGVVRVTHCSAKILKLSPDDLGQLLTALVKAIIGEADTDQTINVNIN